ncbi:MAG: low molecular weight phosphatase family protein [Chloroflexota bacterium]
MLLFLCTGNYYRSRFAELWFNQRAKAAGLPWAAISRGIATELGAGNIGPIADAVVRYLAGRGVAFDGPPRFPQQLCEADLLAAGRVIALHQAEHLPMMLRRFPAWAERIAYWHVADLDGLSAADALPRIAGLVDGLVEQLAGANASCFELETRLMGDDNE